MCGIAGIVRKDPQPDPDWSVLAAMSGSLVHRGPDDQGWFVAGPVGLAHRRLSIIDVAGGRQPMIDADNGRVLVYNGELYNFQPLRAELQANGTQFTTRSDTEVLLRLASAASLDWLRRLNGMFAFALWDEPARTLVLGRDRLGIKPLYYAMLDDEFVFASEIKALLRHPGLSRRVNAERIAEFVAFRCLAGGDTLFDGIHEVPPGHALVVTQRTLASKTIRFWPEDASPAARAGTTEAASVSELETVLADSVRRQLVSDVPVGMYLSGGVDSSLIAVLAKRCRGNEPLHTFSVGFEERDFDESPLANRVARQVGATHHALVIGETDFVAQLEHTVRQHDEPLNHAHTVQLELLSRYAKSLVTVVLTGEGSDELFGGYPRQHLPLLARRLRRLPAPLVHAIRPAAHRLGLRRLSKLLEAAASEADATVHGARFVPWPAMTALFRGVDVPQRLALYEAISRSVSDSVERVLQFDQRTYLPTLLARLDRASMASSVECRVPFLDNDVIDFSRRLPSALKIRPGLDNKIAVKRLAARLVPRDIVYRRKSGFSTPLTTWLRNPRGLGRYLDLLSGRSARVAAYLDLVAVARAVDEHRRGVQDHAEVIWSVLALELWLRHVVDRTDVARPARRAIEPSHFGQLHPALRQS